MTASAQFPAHDVLARAGLIAGVSTEGAALVRDGSNIIYRLRGDLVARIGQPGTEATARLELDVSAWLAGHSFPAVRAAPKVPQPTMVGDRPITWWELLPEHRPSTTAELGATLRKLHQLPVPGALRLAEVDPFNALEARISKAQVLPAEDRLWLASKLDTLRSAYRELPPGLGPAVVHGDAWQGNVVVPEAPFGGDEVPAPIMLDLENVGVGHPEWDLVSVAVDRTDFERISAKEYAAFVSSYGGYDVTAWEGYRTLASIRELRWACFVLSKADTSERAEHEVRHRISCLRGELPRPWKWEAF